MSAFERTFKLLLVSYRIVKCCSKLSESEIIGGACSFKQCGYQVLLNRSVKTIHLADPGSGEYTAIWLDRYTGLADYCW